jgi:hypothetical protein
VRVVLLAEGEGLGRHKRAGEFAAFPESPDAVVDHDGDHAHGDGDRCHPGLDGADASKSMVDERADHHIQMGISRAVNTEIEAERLKRFSVSC